MLRDAILMLTQAHAEASEGIAYDRDLTTDECDLNIFGYHARMMDRHGLLETNVKWAWGNNCVFVCVKRITWEGCEYLDVVRADGTWGED